jgi:hypothetical protein
MTRGRNIRELWCGMVTERVGESYRIHMRVRKGIEDFRNAPCTIKHPDITAILVATRPWNRLPQMF